MASSNWKILAVGAAIIAVGGTTASVFSTPAAPVGTAEMVVYKSATCGCCTKWVDHLRENGFEVRAEDVDNLGQIKSELGVPNSLSSCHTAVIDGYVVEGHVPADLIQRFLDERPDVVGLTVPGMPMGSPGMEGPTSQPYDILTFDKSGNTSVYASR